MKDFFYLVLAYAVNFKMIIMYIYAFCIFTLMFYTLVFLLLF